MTFVIIISSILLLLLLVIVLKLNALFSLIITSVALGIAQGMSSKDILKAIEVGFGNTIGQLALILAMGAVLGKLIADGGGAQKITTTLIRVFGKDNLQWAMVLTGFLVGIPLFYNVGFVVLVPFVFMICASTGLPLLYVGIPLLAALSVTHGFLPPHPGATAITIMYKANMGLTMLYGAIISIPAIIVGGPLFARTLKNIKPNPPEGLFKFNAFPEEKLPSFVLSLFTGLLPVFLIAIATIIEFLNLDKSLLTDIFLFIGNPIIALLVSTFLAIYTMGIRRKKSMKELMELVEESLKSIAMILFIIGAAGIFKEVLIMSGIGEEVSKYVVKLSFSPLILVWLIAAAIRVSLGSATVAGLTAAGIAIPIMEATNASPELMVLATGAGSLMFSHVNDPGFWMFKEYFGLSIKDTIRSWSVMETLVSVMGIIGVLVLRLFI
jgi:gluconate transporter